MIHLRLLIIVGIAALLPWMLPLSWVVPDTIPQQETLPPESYFYHKVQIKDVLWGDGHPYLILETQSEINREIPITGWSIENDGGKRVAIPAGSNSLIQGSIPITLPIVLGTSSKIIASVDPSPVGVSFQQNRCTPYLDTAHTVVPILGSTCPTPELVSGYGALDDACKTYVMDIPPCETRIPEQAQSSLSLSCKNFISTALTYNGCVSNQKTKKNFLLPDWRIFLNAPKNFIHQDKGSLYLLDKTGNLVDTFSYINLSGSNTPSVSR